MTTTTLDSLHLDPHTYSLSRDDDGVEWIWAPSDEPDPACEALVDDGVLVRDTVTDGYQTYRLAAPMIDEMAAELRTLSSDVHQHESLMRASWGADFRRSVFVAAASLVECERAERE